VRLRFSILGHTNDDLIIEQIPVHPQQPSQGILYELLAALWDEAREHAGQGMSASQLFLRSEQ